LIPAAVGRIQLWPERGGDDKLLADVASYSMEKMCIG